MTDIGVIVINDGEMILDGTAKEVFSEVDLLHKIGLESPQSTELVKELNIFKFFPNVSGTVGPHTDTVWTVLECQRAYFGFLWSRNRKGASTEPRCNLAYDSAGLPQNLAVARQQVYFRRAEEEATHRFDVGRCSASSEWG